MIKYKDMIANARKGGLGSEQAMWASIGAVDELLEQIADDDLKHNFLREQQEHLYGPHYDEHFAEHDIERLSWVGRDKQTHTGAHWTKDQVKSAMSDRNLPQGTTACDLWVAANVMYSDLCQVFDEPQIIDATYQFFFCDTDGPDGKIWHYMTQMSAA